MKPVRIIIMMLLAVFTISIATSQTASAKSELSYTVTVDGVAYHHYIITDEHGNKSLKTVWLDDEGNTIEIDKWLYLPDGTPIPYKVAAGYDIDPQRDIIIKTNGRELYFSDFEGTVQVIDSQSGEVIINSAKVNARNNTVVLPGNAVLGIPYTVVCTDSEGIAIKNCFLRNGKYELQSGTRTAK